MLKDVSGRMAIREGEDLAGSGQRLTTRGRESGFLQQGQVGGWMKQFVQFEEMGRPSKWVTLHAMKMLKTLYGRGD